MDRASSQDSSDRALVRRGALAPVERLLDALADPARRGRTGVLLLAAYAAAWMLYGAVAKSSQDVHFDMGEMVALSRVDILGTAKHPPLGSWLVRFWFDVFPAADWAYYLFAILIAVVGLWIAWRLSIDYLDGDKPAVGLAMLTLVPLYNFHALKFNANTVLIPFWAATTWWFLRSFETRNLGYAALAGLAAAAAMLGKYWTVMLLAGLLITALADPRRGAYFRSAAPWVTVTFGALALAPHLVWLIVNDFPPLNYTLDSHALASRGAAVLQALNYVVGALAYLAVPLMLLALMRPSKAALADLAWPRDSSRRSAVLAFVLPILLAGLFAFVFKSGLAAIWTVCAMTLVPVVLLSSPLIGASRATASWIMVLALAFPLVMIAASPVVAIAVHRNGTLGDATHYRLLAQAVERAWYDTTEAPLRLVGSDTRLVNGMIFYLPSRVLAYEMTHPAVTPWIDDERITREGIALTCRADDIRCNGFADRLASHRASGRQVEVTLSRRYFGVDDAAVRYRILTVPPGG
jgi:hypothetical protein